MIATTMREHGSGAVVGQGLPPVAHGETLSDHGFPLRADASVSLSHSTAAGPPAAPPALADAELPAALRLRLVSGTIVSVPLGLHNGGLMTDEGWNSATCDELALSIDVALVDLELGVLDRASLATVYYTYGNKVVEGTGLARSLGLVTDSPVTARLRLRGGMQHAVP